MQRFNPQGVAALLDLVVTKHEMPSLLMLTLDRRFLLVIPLEISAAGLLNYN